MSENGFYYFSQQLSQVFREKGRDNGPESNGENLGEESVPAVTRKKRHCLFGRHHKHVLFIHVASLDYIIYAALSEKRN